MVDIPSYMVRVDSQKHIEFALTSPFGGGKPGRCTRIKTNRKRHDEEVQSKAKTQVKEESDDG